MPRAATLSGALVAIGGAAATSLGSIDLSNVGRPLEAPGSQCSYNFGNSSFDVAPLQITSFWLVNDDRNTRDSSNYTYYFNICANTGLVPTAQNCTATGGNPVLPLSNTWPSPAYQVANTKPNWQVPAIDKCHRLGGDVTVTPINWGLYDTTNPSRGVYLQYTGGDACWGSPGVYRSLRVFLLCYNDAVNVPDAETVMETGSCQYDIYVNSAYGCPADCPAPQDPVTLARNLCSGHGVCDFDRALGTSRCFCNGGWEGKDCGAPTQPPAKGLSATGGVLIGVGIFLAITLGFLVFLWTRIRSLRLDPTAYSALRGGPEAGDATVQ